MFLKKVLATIFLILGFTLPAFCCDKIKVKMPRVLDGDTVKVRLEQGDVSIRMSGIDCFETHVNDNMYRQMRKTPLSREEILSKGNSAKVLLEGIVSKNQQNIWFELLGLDRKYGRLAGVIYYKDAQGNFVNINKIMEKSGFCPVFIYKSRY